MKTDDPKFEQIARQVRQKLQVGGCHDFDHTLRVMHLAEQLLQTEPAANRDVVRYAALLHDIARPEEYAGNGKVCHALLGAEIAAELLKNSGFPTGFTEHVAAVIAEHRFRSDHHPQTLESWIVHDADKLDSLGACGIGRAFLFAGRCGARLHNRESEALAGKAYGPEDTAYREYLIKLRHLPERIHTAGGKKIAAERLQLMETFFAALNQEVYG